MTEPNDETESGDAVDRAEKLDEVDGDDLVPTSLATAEDLEDLGGVSQPERQVDVEKLVSGAEERIDDIEAEFGPNQPRRGATPQNPDAEESPT